MTGYPPLDYAAHVDGCAQCSGPNDGCELGKELEGALTSERARTAAWAIRFDLSANRAERSPVPPGVHPTLHAASVAAMRAKAADLRAELAPAAPSPAAAVAVDDAIAREVRRLVAELAAHPGPLPPSTLAGVDRVLDRLDRLDDAPRCQLAPLRIALGAARDRHGSELGADDV